MVLWNTWRRKNDSEFYHLSSEYRSQPGYMIAYFYCPFNNASKQTSNGCLRSIARQLYVKSDGVPVSIKSLYDASKGG